jgi:AraC-like DNA-binding protein
MQPLNQYLASISSPKQLDRLVENRKVYSTEKAELNVYETYEAAQLVELQFSNPVLVSMVSGKKVMHFRNTQPFEFVPRQSIVLPPNEFMKIDFPDATLHNPTRCLALAISDEMIDETLQLMNEQFPRTDNRQQWEVATRNFLLNHDPAIDMAINRLVYIFTEQNKALPIFSDLILKELLIRLLQTEARHTLLYNSKCMDNTHPLAHVAQYIKDHLQQMIPVDALCRKAGMNRAQFFKSFKNEFGITPVEYINQERVKLAQRILRKPSTSITDACYEAGFAQPGYFIRVFKKLTGLTPGEFKKRHSLKKISC